MEERIEDAIHVLRTHAIEGSTPTPAPSGTPTPLHPHLATHSTSALLPPSAQPYGAPPLSNPALNPMGIGVDHSHMVSAFYNCFKLPPLPFPLDLSS